MIVITIIYTSTVTGRAVRLQKLAAWRLATTSSIPSV
jgi:hypothetical protein